MIKFKKKNQTNTVTNNITNEEINLKIHEMIMGLYHGRDAYISDIYESINHGMYKKVFLEIKKHIHD